MVVICQIKNNNQHFKIQNAAPAHKIWKIKNPPAVPH
jgi:hypothetical protein